jgi:two-component system cell cycle sensor histidine kinase/response regulator CckA
LTHATEPAGTFRKSGDAKYSSSNAARLSLVWLAVALLAAGLLIPDQKTAQIAVALGAGLSIIYLTLQHFSKPKVKISQSLENLINHDERSVLVTHVSGEILKRNPAARKRFGDTEGQALELILANLMQNANAIIFRLQAKAERQNSARETVVTRNGRYQVSVHQIATDQLLWAIEPVLDAAGPVRSVDKISLPMMTVGNSGTILFMNDALRRFIGDRAKSLDRIFTDVPEQSDAICALQTKDGLVDVRVIIVPGNAGRTEYFLIPVEVNAAPVASLSTLEDFPVALLKIKPDGNIAEANRLARGLMKLEGRQSVRLTDLVEGLGRPIGDWLLDASEGRSLQKPEVLRLSGQDEEMYLQVTLGRVIENGEVALMAMINDATELKSLEAQFVQSQKMQAIGQLAGGVAHDFNNLLTAISGHCDLLMLRHDPGDLDFGDLEQINQNATRAASLVGQLLAFSRKQNLRLEVLDMRDTLSDLTHLLNRLVGAQIVLNLIHDPQLMPVRTDRRQLEQVIMNLVVNARDAMGGSGGEIRIETRNMKLKRDLRRDRAIVPSGDYVLVKVTDDGSGIPADKLPKIFEPFFTTKRTGEGTGLGLSTAYGIVKQSGGFIFVDSEEGRGTTFTIFFPSFDRPVVELAPARKPTAVVDNSLAEGVVLLVEDEAPVRAFACRALKLRGYQVLEANCAEEALSLLENEDLNVDIVVSDVVMPGMDGPTWVRKAQEKRPELRVIFVSGYAEDSFSENQALIPNSIFLPKPFSLNDLTITVRQQLQTSS